MALISSFDPTTNDRRRPHKPTHCLYEIFKDKAGATYLQLDTCGSEERLLKGKTSQSLLIDKAAAIKLRKLLDEAFPPSP